MVVLKFSILIVISYLFGNIFFAKILTKLLKKDITKTGSGNPGTMNMVRNFGLILGLLTLLLDALKGAIPAIVGYHMFGGELGGMMAIYAMYTAGFSAVLGHVFPVVYNFKGGKGVATTIGFCTAVYPLLSLIVFGVALIVWIIVKIGSVASLVYVTSFAVAMAIMHFETAYILPLIILFTNLVLIYVMHRSNIKKLFKGQENKIDFNKSIEKDKENLKAAKQALTRKKTTKIEE